jgi:hypothetical protein
VLALALAAPPAIVLAAAGPVAAAAAATGPFGDFAGYQWFGRPRATSASWTVPAITSPQSTRPAMSAQWIGVQGPTNAFIQVGTVEVEAGSGTRDVAFWADTNDGFLAIPIATVHPGDEVQAELRRARAGWHVELADQSSGRSLSFTTPEERAGPFDTAEFAAERPMPGDPTWSYAGAAPLAMSALQVNGRPVLRRALHPTWMSLPGMNLGPTWTGDGFTIAPEPAVEPAGARYAAAVELFRKPAYALELAEATWSAATTAAQVATTVQPVLAGLARCLARARSEQWPPGARRDILTLWERAERRLAPRLVALESAPASQRAAAYAAYAAGLVTMRRLAWRIERELGLPEV